VSARKNAWPCLRSMASFFLRPLLSLSQPSHPPLSPTPKKRNNSYYAQRATSGGLLISEATNICPGAQGKEGELQLVLSLGKKTNETKTLTLLSLLSILSSCPLFLSSLYLLLQATQTRRVSGPIPR